MEVASSKRCPYREGGGGERERERGMGRGRGGGRLHTAFMNMSQLYRCSCYSRQVNRPTEITGLQGGGGCLGESKR